MKKKHETVTSGIPDMDRLLGGGIFIGDNVVWYDDVGLLAPVFCLNLVQSSRAEKKSLIYINFDSSPKNLLDRLGRLADNTTLTILDCFSHGKGESSPVFLDFYHQPKKKSLCNIVCVENPQDANQVAKTFYDLHQTMAGDVRFVFDSLTGMQSLWGSEEAILHFYSTACPRLYELNTIAYWIVEKGAHSERLKAHFNKITQVAVDLSVKRGKTYFSVLKAEKRDLSILNQPVLYWSSGLQVTFDSQKTGRGVVDLGGQLRALRLQRGMSQKDLARQLGVTPSNISQVENNQIYPSIPALIKLAEAFSVDIGNFFTGPVKEKKKIVFSEFDAVKIVSPGSVKDEVTLKRMLPDDKTAGLEIYLVEIESGARLSSHFFNHKGIEAGCLLSGALQLVVDGGEQSVSAGEVVLLTEGIPSSWKNKETIPARMLWIKPS